MCLKKNLLPILALSGLSSVFMGSSVQAASLSGIPDIELGGIAYEISFESAAFNLANLDPNLLALIEAQPWYTGAFNSSLALDAASQVYDCSGFQGSLCSTPFDEFGSVNPFFGGTSPFFIFGRVGTQINAAAVGFPAIRGTDNELSTIGVSSSGSVTLHYAVATPKSVPEPHMILGYVAVAGLGLAMKKKQAH